MINGSIIPNACVLCSSPSSVGPSKCSEIQMFPKREEHLEDQPNLRWPPITGFADDIGVRGCPKCPHQIINSLSLSLPAACHSPPPERPNWLSVATSNTSQIAPRRAKGKPRPSSAGERSLFRGNKSPSHEKKGLGPPLFPSSAPPLKVRCRPRLAGKLSPLQKVPCTGLPATCRGNGFSLRPTITLWVSA